MLLGDPLIALVQFPQPSQHTEVAELTEELLQHEVRRNSAQLLDVLAHHRTLTALRLQIRTFLVRWLVLQFVRVGSGQRRRSIIYLTGRTLWDLEGVVLRLHLLRYALDTECVADKASALARALASSEPTATLGGSSSSRRVASGSMMYRFR